MAWRTHPEVRTFVDTGQAFRHLVASPEPCGAWLSTMLSRLLALYAAGLALPPGSVEEEEGEEVFAVPHDEWETLWQRLGEALGPNRWYVSADPQMNVPGSSDAVAVGDLADDLADIYRDITPGLRYWETAATAELGNIVWEWRFSFTTHWGRHAVAALGILHHLVVVEHLDMNGDTLAKD